MSRFPVCAAALAAVVLFLSGAASAQDWTQKTPAHVPAKRLYPAMAQFSNVSQVSGATNVVMFGGVNLGSSGVFKAFNVLGDTWIWNDTDWAQLTISSSTAAAIRRQHGLLSRNAQWDGRLADSTGDRAFPWPRWSRELSCRHVAVFLPDRVFYQDHLQSGVLLDTGSWQRTFGQSSGTDGILLDILRRAVWRYPWGRHHPDRWFRWHQPFERHVALRRPSPELATRHI